MSATAITKEYKVRNAGIAGHEGSGKTTLIEHLLFTAGEIQRAGSVTDGNTVGDYLEEEIDHHHTTCMKLMHLDWNGYRVHLVDHPGYTDFIGELAASTPLLDGLVILVDGGIGTQIGTDNAVRYAKQYDIPHIFFINKLDKDHSSFDQIVHQIQQSYGSHCIPLIIPNYSQDHLDGVISLTSGETEELMAQAQEFKSSIIDVVAESDDELLEKYLDAGDLSAEEINQGLRAGIRSGNIVPIIGGSAETEIGTQQLLEYITSLFPSPLEREFKAHNGSEDEIIVNPDPDQPFMGQVFHSVVDPFVGQLTFFRVLSGKLKSDSEFYNTTTHNKERTGKLFLLNGKEQTQVNEVGPGDLAAMTKLKHTHFGDTLTSKDNGMEMPVMEMPEAFVKLAITPKSRADEEKIGEALHRLEEEDPTFHHYRDENTHEHIVSGIGDMQLDILLERMRTKFHVEAETHVPKVAYMESIKTTADVQGKHKKQSGGHGQYGDVHIKLSPLPRGEKYKFVDSIVGGVVPRQYIPHVDKGAQDALTKGVLAGFPVVDVQVELYDGTYHNVDSSEMAFKIATSQAIKKGVMAATPYLLEPIVELEVIVPEEYMGDITGDINSRRGHILGMDSVSIGVQQIKAHVPEAEILKYFADLKSITHGQGNYSLHFSHYDEVPELTAKQIIAAFQKEKAEGNGSH
jgi:elongation factor G